MQKWVFINDAFIEEEKACLHFKDLSFQRGYGIFDFFRLVENRPLFLDDHLERFNSSATSMHLLPPFEKQVVAEVIEDLISKNNQPNTGVRLALTGGYSEDGFTISSPNFVISQHSFTSPTKEQVANGSKLISYPHQRQLPNIKTIDYLKAIWLQPMKFEKGADEILYYSNDFITECPRSNFFLVTQENRIVTPSRNILRGITRKNLLALAKKDFEVEERDILLSEISVAKEAFITSTSKQILPVSMIDRVVLGKPQVSIYLLQLFLQAYY